MVSLLNKRCIHDPKEFIKNLPSQPLIANVLILTPPNGFEFDLVERKAEWRCIVFFMWHTCFFGHQVNMWRVLTINIKLNISICVERPKRMEILRNNSNNNWTYFQSSTQRNTNKYKLSPEFGKCVRSICSFQKEAIGIHTLTQRIHIEYQSNYQQIVQQIFLHLSPPFSLSLAFVEWHRQTCSLTLARPSMCSCNSFVKFIFCLMSPICYC